MPKLVFSRHRSSEWNVLNQFTEWADVDLTPEGVEGAKEGDCKIREVSIEFDVAYTSVLARAIKTCNYLLEHSDQLWVPRTKSWYLNERRYGRLRGLNEKETAKRYGDEQVHIQRHSYDTLPPLMEVTDEGSAANDHHYAMLDQRDIPGDKDSKVTSERALPSWQDEIAPALKDNKTISVAAHGNSLRTLAKHTKGISDEDIIDLEIPIGKPLAYELGDDLTVKEEYYL